MSFLKVYEYDIEIVLASLYKIKKTPNSGLRLDVFFINQIYFTGISANVAFK